MNNKIIISYIYDLSVYFPKMLKRDNIEFGDIKLPEYAKEIKSYNEYFVKYDFRYYKKKTKLKSYKLIENEIGTIDGAITLLQKIDTLRINDKRMNLISEIVGDNYNRDYVMNKVLEKFGEDYLETADIFVKGSEILDYIERKYVKKEYRSGMY